MKQTIKSLGSVLLVLCLLAALLPCAAFADVGDEYYSVNWTGSQYGYSNWVWYTPSGESFGSAYVEEGMLPDGLYISGIGTNELTVSGTPSVSGMYDARIRLDTVNYTYYLDIDFNITATQQQDEMYCNDGVQAQVGTALSNWSWGTINGENISNIYVSYGSLPNGLYIPTPGSNAFQICGTPTTAGSGSFTVCVETFDTIYYVDISYTIAAAQQTFTITKSPTTETAKEGGNATYIATATGYSYVDWLLMSGGTTVGTYRGESNTMYGTCNVITYKDNGKEYLVLKNIPSSMNGYTVQARFTNSSGTSILTQACYLYVQATATPSPSPTATPAPDMKAPSITVQPTAVTQTVGNNAVLSVAASDPNSGTLAYQWYSNTAATSTGATAIAGANQSSYSAPQTVGTIYYYCSVTSTKDGKTSPAVTTTPVAVTYSDPNASPSPSTSPAVSPSASPAADSSKSTSHGSGLLVLMIVLIILVAICLILQIIYISKRNQGKAVPMIKWDCPKCGTRNKAGSHFCSECGAKNPMLRSRDSEE